MNIPNIFFNNLKSELENTPIMLLDDMKQEESHPYTKRQDCHSEGPQQAGGIRLTINLEVQQRQNPTPRTEEPHAMNSMG